MKNTIQSIIVIIAIITISGCSRWIAPPYSNVEKLSSVKIGMNLQQVNSQLGIDPYDIYFKGNNNYVVVYNYRVKDRLMEISGNYNAEIHSENGQSNGKDWYGQNYYSYIYFFDNKVKSIITDVGKIKSEDILINKNNLYLIQKDKVGFYIKNDTTYFYKN